MRASLIMIMLLSAALAAQGEVRPATQTDVRPPLQDSKALLLLDKADLLTYSAKVAGLKDLTYFQSLSQYPGLAVEVKWMLPDRRTAKVVLKADAPEHTKRIATSLEKVLVPQVLQVLDNVIGKDNRSTYAIDEISLVSERLVRVVPRSPKNASIFSENLITFDQRGLPIVTKTRKPSGVSQDVQVAWEAVGTTGKYRVQSISSDVTEEKSQVRFAYTEVGGFQFPKSITVETRDNTVIFSFDEHRPNTGLTAKDFPGS